jgi:toxin ParE1/3/4
MKIRISGKARAELLEIYRYLSERNPAVADRTAADVDAKLRQLAHFPFMGRERPEFAPRLRSVLVRTYLVFYTFSDDGIVIMRVIDGRMDIDKEFRK